MTVRGSFHRLLWRLVRAALYGFVGVVVLPFFLYAMSQERQVFFTPVERREPLWCRETIGTDELWVQGRTERRVGYDLTYYGCTSRWTTVNDEPWALASPYLVVVRMGWPLRSFWGWKSQAEISENQFVYRTHGVNETPPRWYMLVPTRPIWSGLAVNGLLFFAVGLIADAGVAAAISSVIRIRRRQRGQCEACGYDLGSLAVCPECGMRTG